MKTDKEIFELALKEFPYDEHAGNVEDDIDAAKRSIWIAGFKQALKLSGGEVKKAFDAGRTFLDVEHSEFKKHRRFLEKLKYKNAGEYLKSNNLPIV